MANIMRLGGGVSKIQYFTQNGDFNITKVIDVRGVKKIIEIFTNSSYYGGTQYVSFKSYGSNDGSSWTLISEKTVELFEKEFVNNYKYYKIEAKGDVRSGAGMIVIFSGKAEKIYTDIP